MDRGRHGDGLLIGGTWRAGRERPFRSTDPSGAEIVWEGPAAAVADVEEAVAAARTAGPAWEHAGLETRCGIVERFAAAVEREREALAMLISREVGKPLWESRTEVASMIGKISISVAAYRQRCGEIEAGGPAGSRAVARFRPHGVMAVLGPFNFPGHLPGGHMVPALVAGNTVVFKPSERAVAVGRRLAELWCEAGVPAGVINFTAGDAATGRALVDADIDGVLFTGSEAAGLALSERLARRPGVLLALELGGNNPLLVHDAGDLDAAVVITIRSAYATAGQRCTCARRLIVPRGHEGDRFIERLIERIGRVRVGWWNDQPEPFMGPLIDEAAAEAVLSAERRLVTAGAVQRVALGRMNRAAALLTPGLIDVTPLVETGTLPDHEIFGPLLQMVRTDDLDSAIETAAATRFGLAAAIVTDEREHYEMFRARVRAGCVNWNQPTTGAASGLPFGGVGHSGNHRPSAYLAADYCSFPVASLESGAVGEPGDGASEIPGLDR